MVSRLIDPTHDLERAADAQHGVATMGDLRRQVEQGQKLDAEFSRTQTYLYHETVEFYLHDVPANATTAMRQLFLLSTTTLRADVVVLHFGRPGKIISIRLMTNADITAGTATPRITIDDGAFSTAYDITGCELNATTFASGNVHVFPWDTAPEFSSNDVMQVLITTDVAFLPITADMKCYVTMGYTDWI